MTYGNQILINNNKYWLYGEPLDSYWNLIKNKPNLGSFSTSPLDKGYYAEWLIRDNKMYLIDFNGSDFRGKTKYQFEDFFGTKETPFFAFWFSGVISIQEGEVIFSDHHFGNTKKYNFNFEFKQGILMETFMEENK
jgi:hypothetical protein